MYMWNRKWEYVTSTLMLNDGEDEEDVGTYKIIRFYYPYRLSSMKGLNY